MYFFKQVEKFISKMLTKKGVSSHVRPALNRTLKKAKKYKGDAFYEYRKSGIIPKKFEYGMNCFVDRIFEQEGEKVAQKTYEELIKIGACAVSGDTLSTDIEGIPILFGVENIGIACKAYNNAVGILNYGKEKSLDAGIEKIKAELLKNAPKKLEDETGYEYTWRLTALFFGIAHKEGVFNKQGKSSAGEKLALYRQAVGRLIPECNQELTDKDTELLMYAAGSIEKIMPGRETELIKFLSDMFIGTTFWRMVWNSILKHFQSTFRGLSGPEVMKYTAFYAKKVERQSRIPVLDESKKKSRNFIVSEEYNAVWKEIKNRVEESFKIDNIPASRDALLIISITIFLDIFGYKGGFDGIIQGDDWFILKSLFDRLITETMQDAKMIIS